MQPLVSRSQRYATRVIRITKPQSVHLYGPDAGLRSARIRQLAYIDCVAILKPRTPFPDERRLAMSRPHESPRFIALIAAVALLMTQIGMTREPARIGSLSATKTKNLELLLRSELLTVLGREKTQPGESPAASLLRGVRVDRTSNLVIVELSKDYLPAGVANYSAELEDRLHRMTTGILWSIENELKLSAAGVSYIFDGQPLWFYYPEDFPDHKPNAKPPTKATHGKNTPIIVSAGHGAYLFHGTSPSTWRYQRDAAFGIREDTMTQLLTDELADLLITRSGATVGFVRDFSTTAHTPSGLPWSDVAAR